jgi:hypothetical protein
VFQPVFSVLTPMRFSTLGFPFLPIESNNYSPPLAVSPYHLLFFFTIPTYIFIYFALAKYSSFSFSRVPGIPIWSASTAHRLLHFPFQTCRRLLGRLLTPLHTVLEHEVSVRLASVPCFLCRELGPAESGIVFLDSMSESSIVSRSFCLLAPSCTLFFASFCCHCILFAYWAYVRHLQSGGVPLSLLEPITILGTSAR